DASGAVIAVSSLYEENRTDTITIVDSLGNVISTSTNSFSNKIIPSSYVKLKTDLQVTYTDRSSMTHTVSGVFPVEVAYSPNDISSGRMISTNMQNLKNEFHTFFVSDEAASAISFSVTPIEYYIDFVGYPGIPDVYIPKTPFGSGYPIAGNWPYSGHPELPRLDFYSRTDLHDLWNRGWALTTNLYLDLNILVTEYDNQSVSLQKVSKKVVYDNNNRVASSITADEGESDFVYDNEDKLRFSQNDKQRTTGSGGKFTYVNYDRAARPIETGEYDPTASGSGNPYYFRTEAQYAGSTNTAPSGHTDIFYDITNNLQVIAADNRSGQKTQSSYDVVDGNLNSYVSGYNQTHLSAKVAKTWNNYSTSWYSYDELGRLSWAVQQTNERSIFSNPYKTYNYTYNLQGNVLQTAYNKENSSEDFYHKFDYDADQRLTQASTSFDGSTWTLQDKYYYYLHGPLKREEIQTNLQGIDYVYTINGMLKSINHPSLNNLYDPGQDSKAGTAHSGFNNDVFGFALDYYTNDYTRSSTNVQSYSGGTDLFGGTIKAARWQTQNPASTTGLMYTGQQLMYTYAYDDQYRLSTATFGTYTGSTGSISLTNLSDYKTDNLTYDLNGNIKTLRRKAQNLNWPSPALNMDDLTYNYHSTKTNRLLQVSDAEAMAPLSPDIDLPTQSSSSNYTYNEIGQVTANAQEGTTTEYDVYGQVQKVYKTSGGNKIARFLYNDKGLRAAKISYNSSGYKQSQLNYMYDAAGSLVATYLTTFNITTPDSTSILTGPYLQDYVVYGAGRLGTYDVASTTNFYEMSDHLGNVRAVYKNNGTGAEVVSFTDYYPHGGAMPGRNYVGSPTYRYAYNGQEKDAETSLTNFELRQFDVRVGRWFAPDPMGQHHSPYLAMANNPISMIDPTGGADLSWGDALMYAQQVGNDYSIASRRDPNGLLSYGGNTTFSQNGMGDNFFATDAHFHNSDWASSGERTQNYFAAKEGYQSTMHDYLVLRSNYYNETNGQWGFMKDDDGNYKDAFQSNTGKHSGTLSLAELFVTDASGGGWTTKSEDFFVISTFTSSSDLYRQAMATKSIADNFTKAIAMNRQGGNITPDYSFEGGAVVGAWAKAAIGAIATRFFGSATTKGIDVVNSSHSTILPTQDWINPSQVANYQNVIRSGGELNPIITYRNASGVFIEDGHHRYVASILEGIQPRMIIRNTGGPVGYPNWLNTTYVKP
ncbi:MAG TPA: RHS repeat-associated core domain-containing protein, partial [Bacteroidia bacterium]|nr:RHS repeat-associated core domain-containing protein [Bacteroidia bacterium]